MVRTDSDEVLCELRTLACQLGILLPKNKADALLVHRWLGEYIEWASGNERTGPRRFKPELVSASNS